MNEYIIAIVGAGAGLFAANVESVTNIITSVTGGSEGMTTYGIGAFGGALAALTIVGGAPLTQPTIMNAVVGTAIVCGGSYLFGEEARFSPLIYK